jgi:hypothetical protein
MGICSKEELYDARYWIRSSQSGASQFEIKSVGLDEAKNCRRKAIS